MPAPFTQFFCTRNNAQTRSKIVAYPTFKCMEAPATTPPPASDTVKSGQVWPRT